MFALEEEEEEPPQPLITEEEPLPPPRRYTELDRDVVSVLIQTQGTSKL